MKKIITPTLYSLFTFLFIFAGTSLMAQQGKTTDANVRIRIEKSENGQIELDEKNIRVENNTQIQEILRQNGLDQEFGTLKPGEEVEIIIRRKGNTGQNEEFVIELETLGAQNQQKAPRFEIEKTGRPLLGVHYQLAGESDSDSKGVKVIQVVPNSGAEKAGIKMGDVLLSVDGKEINNMSFLYDYVATKKPGDKIKLKVNTGNKIEKITATLGEAQARQDFRVRQPHFRPMPPEKPRMMLGVYTGESQMDGIVINNIASGSLAEEMGLKAGDILQKINGLSTPNREAIAAIMDQIKPGDNVTVNYLRDNQNGTGRGKAKLPESPKEIRKEVIRQIDENGNVTEEIRIFDGNDTEQILDIETDDEVILKETIIRITMDAVSAQEAQSMTEKTGEEFGKSDLIATSLDLYPNPTRGVFKVDFTLPEKGDVALKIFDANGEMVYSEMLKNFSGAHSSNIDLSDISAGNYFLRLSQNEKFYTRKIVIQ